MEFSSIVGSVNGKREEADRTKMVKLYTFKKDAPGSRVGGTNIVLIGAGAIRINEKWRKSRFCGNGGEMRE